MSNSNKTKTIRIPIFDKKEENFQTWQVRFRANRKLSGFIKALEEIPDPDLLSNQAEVEALTGTDDDTKSKRAAVKRNDLAIASLILVFSTDELVAMILQAQLADWLEGLASEVVKQLKEKYKPEHIMSLVNEKVELNKIRMSPSENPKLLFDRIKSVET